MSGKDAIKLEKMDEYRWLIPVGTVEGMRVPGLIFTSEELVPLIEADKTAQQVVNVAHLPGIVGYSLAMPDIHWGYGFPIGGVAAVRMEEGVISPGGVGSDINCGVRLLKTDLRLPDVEGVKEKLVDALFNNVPCGVGSHGKVRLNQGELNKVLEEGAGWAVRHGFGWEEDLEFTEERGCLSGADSGAVSKRARERGYDQLGTLGSGNHFLEIQVVEEIFDEETAGKLGLEEGLITVMIHTGSRGLGYQVCDDYLARMGEVMLKYNINLPDRQLASAPINSPEGRAYFSAMAAAANYAWANRQIITHLVRESFASVFGRNARDLEMRMIYDVAHNIAKRELHTVSGKQVELLVHRKGATRAFPPGHPDLPDELPVGRDRGGHVGFFRLHLPRRRAPLEPEAGHKGDQGTGDTTGDGGLRHFGPLPRSVHPPGGILGCLQGYRRYNQDRGGCRVVPPSSQDEAPGGGKGLNARESN